MRFIIEKKFTYLLVAIGIVLVSAACNDTPSKDKQSILTGSVTILVDETFEPIIEDQAAVFESSYKASSIKVVARPERTVVRNLLDDSAKIAIMARTLTKEEESFFIENMKIYPVYTKFAVDGLALIASKEYADSTVNVEDIIKKIRGEESSLTTLVFDNARSSTVRYLQAFAEVDTLPAQGIYAMKSNADVIRYVEQHPQSVGLIGINWIYQPDKNMKDLVNRVKVLRVGDSESGYYKPTQTSLALDRYPFSRDLYLINCQGGTGLGMGFASFLAGQRGQRIILKSGLLPDSIPSREIIIRN